MKLLQLKTYSETKTFLEEAYERSMQSTQSKKPKFTGALKTLPESVRSDRWEISKEAISATLDILFKLHAKAYFLVVVDGKPETFAKLTFEKPSNLIQTSIEKRYNKTLRWPYKGIHPKTLRRDKNKVSVFQCRIKPNADADSKFAWEYMKLLSECPALPNGIFVFTLSDMVLIPEEIGGVVWPFVSKAITFDSNVCLPVLNGSGQKGYLDIPIPNFDDFYYAWGYTKLEGLETDWSKKVAKAVFRGSMTGCGYTANTNTRLRLAKLSEKYGDRDFLDAGLTRLSGSLRFDPEKGLGYYNEKTESVKPVSYMSDIEQSRCKYIIHVDGNVAAFRLLTKMLTGSVPLIVEGDYTLWFQQSLKEGKHYLSIKKDLSNLIEVIEWCRDNDSKCKKIASEAKSFAEKLLTKQCITGTLAKILWEL